MNNKIGFAAGISAGLLIGALVWQGVQFLQSGYQNNSQTDISYVCENTYGNATAILTLDVRVEPIMRSDVVASIPASGRIRVLEVLGDFFYVEYRDSIGFSTNGWVLNYDVQLDE